MRDFTKRSISLALTALLLIGMLAGIVLPVSAVQTGEKLSVVKVTENVAEYTSGSSVPYPSTMLADGINNNNNNMWHTKDNVTDAYVTLDLGKEMQVFYLQSYTRTNNEITRKRNIRDYDIWVSNTAPVYSSTNGAVPTGLAATPTDSGTMAETTTAAYGTITLPEDSHGRYVTLHIKNVYDTANRAAINILELEVYGAVMPDAPKLTGVTILDVNRDSYRGSEFPVDSMVDGIIGDKNNFWNCEEKLQTCYMTFDLQSCASVEQILVYARNSSDLVYNRNIKEYDVYVSNVAPVYSAASGAAPTGLPASPAKSGTMEQCSASDPYGTILLPTNCSGRYVTISVKSIWSDTTADPKASPNIAEVEFYGTKMGRAKLASDGITVVGHNAQDYNNASVGYFPASKMLDGVKNNSNDGFWGTTGNHKTNVYVSFDLGEVQALSDLVVYARPNTNTYNRCIKDYTVYMGDSAPVYSDVGAVPTNIGTAVTSGTLGLMSAAAPYDVINLPEDSEGRFVTIHIKNLNGGPTVDIAEIEFYEPLSLVQWAAQSAAEAVSVDYESATLVLPEFDGTEGKIQSSSDESLIALDGKVETLWGGEAQVVLRYTDSNGNYADSAPFTVNVTGLRQRTATPCKLVAADAGDFADKYSEINLINGVAGGTAAGGNYAERYWSTNKNVKETELLLTMEKAGIVTGVSMLPCENVNTYFPQEFEILVSTDGDVFTSVLKKSGYKAVGNDAQYFYFAPQENVKYVKVICKTEAEYIQLSELEVLTTPALQTAAEAAVALQAVQQDRLITFDGITEQFAAEITGSSNTGLVALDGTVTLPAEATDVTLTVKVTNRFDTTDTATVTRTVNVKTQAMLDVEAVAKETDLIPVPELNSDKITYPDIPEGYTIEIVESDTPAVVDTKGNIYRSDDTTYRVRLTFKITQTESGATALTKALLVPIYKTYVAPTMSEEEAEKIRADYAAKKYGIFVHYIPESDVIGHGTVYADGNVVQTTDELVDNFDAEQFAKDVHDFGMEYVVFTVWHYQGQALFPSMTMQRWRDDRRSEGNDDYKTYAEGDIVEELLDALEPYGIDLHLYNHPAGGVSYSSEDKLNCGWDDKTDNYATWNQYINELYYELGDRYGDRLKGLWLDGIFNHIPAGEPQERLRATAEMFNPAMVLTMNCGFQEGNLDLYPQHNLPDNRCWEINRYVDYVNDLEISRYQVATCLAQQYWWTMIPSDRTFKMQPANEMFQYLVALSSITQQGGLLASTGVYPVREGEELDSIWLNGMKEMLTEVNSYLEPVAEAVKNTSIGKAFPTTENVTIKDLEWGVSTESRDGRNVYLHVLKAPEGNTLTLPATADGTELKSEAVIMNFDETTTPVTITKTDSGYTVTLPEGVEWNEVDTVIKTTRAGYGEAAIGEQSFETLEEALAAAEADDVITLYANAEADQVILHPDITLDLNGNTLTAGYLVGFKGSAVYGGKLKAPIDKVVLDRTNDGYLPVYDADGYVFTTVKLEKRTAFVNENTFAFSPVFESVVHKMLEQGYEKSGVSVVVRVMWKETGNYEAKQDYIYLDEMVQRVIGSYDETKLNYKRAFSAAFSGNEAGSVENIQVSAVILSDTGVEIASIPIKL